MLAFPPKKMCTSEPLESLKKKTDVFSGGSNVVHCAGFLLIYDMIQNTASFTVGTCTVLRVDPGTEILCCHIPVVTAECDTDFTVRRPFCVAAGK